MISKAVIAAAGRGTRMLQLAKNKPKHLIRVHDRPFLYYLLQNLKEAGLKELILVVGHLKEQMEEFKREYNGVFPLTLVDQFAECGKERYGTAMPILAARRLVKEEPFLAIYGDSLYSPTDIRLLATRKDAFHYLSVIRHSHPEKYGVITTQGDFMQDWHEKPQKFISNLINTGLYKFMPEIFNSLEQLTPSLRGEYELTDIVRAFGQQQKVKVHHIQDYWFDFGNPGDVIKVHKFLSGTYK